MPVYSISGGVFICQLRLQPFSELRIPLPASIIAGTRAAAAAAITAVSVAGAAAGTAACAASAVHPDQNRRDDDQRPPAGIILSGTHITRHNSTLPEIFFPDFLLPPFFVSAFGIPGTLQNMRRWTVWCRENGVFSVRMIHIAVLLFFIFVYLRKLCAFLHFMLANFLKCGILIPSKASFGKNFKKRGNYPCLS